VIALWVLAAVALSAVFGVVAPMWSRRLPPSLAAWLLSAGGLAVALASSAAVALLAFVFVAQAEPFVDRGHWSDAALRAHDTAALPVGVVGLVLLLLATMRAGRTLVHRLTALRSSHRLAAALSTSELAVLDTDDVHACAVPGRPGRIAVSRGLLQKLDAPERRALLAHERAHLAHRHHWHQTAALLAAAMNPLLSRLPHAVDLACERWADEEAAVAASRAAVAAALRVAAAARPQWRPSVVLAAAAVGVVSRIEALSAPVERVSRWRLVALGAVVVAVLAAVAVGMHETEALFELARRAYRAGHR
jgi:Zn-dependent protease with chaperone function